MIKFNAVQDYIDEIHCLVSLILRHLDNALFKPEINPVMLFLPNVVFEVYASEVHVEAFQNPSQIQYKVVSV